MDIAQASGDAISIVAAFRTAVLGYVIVFAGMILLILVIMGVSRIMQSKQPAKSKNDVVPVEVKAAAPIPAPGTAGEIKLNNVSERDAAMIMAIVAHQLGKPLNELRFISIKEIDSQ